MRLTYDNGSTALGTRATQLVLSEQEDMTELCSTSFTTRPTAEIVNCNLRSRVTK